MKTAVLTGFLIVYSAVAFAQTPAAPPQPAPRTITLTGCVGGGANAQPITLANAMVVPGGDVNAAAAPSPVPGAVSPGATQPPSAAGTPGAVGTSGTAGAGAATGGAAAGVGTPTVSGAVGTSGTIAGTAPAGSSTSSVSGYRLTGADMKGWVGRRVQIVGSLAPATAGASAPAAGASTAASTPEFRVVSVQPVTGDCPKQ